MGAPLGFKTFATGDVLTAADTNGYLMQGVWVFADAAARTAAVTSPQEGNMSYLKSDDKTYYYNGSAWTALGASKVVQIVSATYSTSTTSSTSTFVDTGLSATITPTSASNNVLVIVQQNGVRKGGSNTSMQLKLRRASTDIVAFGNRDGETGNADFNVVGTSGTVYVDSPATTSATTYKTMFCSFSNIADVSVQWASSVSTILLMEVTP